MLLGIILIRGGFQLKPMRPADAFLNDNSITGYLVLNTPYSIIQSGFQDDIEKFSFMAGEDAEKISRSLFADSNESFINNDFAFLRKTNYPGQVKKLNVVVLIWKAGRRCTAAQLPVKKRTLPF